MAINVILSNKCQCRLCGDIIESRFKTDLKYCECGSIYIDGGKDCLKRCINLADVIEMSDYYEL